MCWYIVLLMCISRTVTVNSAPLLLYQLPLDNSLIQMQQQMQEMQLLRQMEMASQIQIQQPAALMVLPKTLDEEQMKLPDVFKNNPHRQNNKIDNNLFQHVIDNNSNEDDSEVIEASSPEENMPPRVLVMLPQGKFSVGSIIQGIPWLPFEVNVPDTILWAWNGISSIISGIGQRLPIRRPLFKISQDEIIKMVKQSTLRDDVMPMPVIIMPVPVPLNLNMATPWAGLMNNRFSQT